MPLESDSAFIELRATRRSITQGCLEDGMALSVSGVMDLVLLKKSPVEPTLNEKSVFLNDP